MKIALVHDYLYTYGGAERVLEALSEIWPEAPIYTAWVDWYWLKKEKPEWKNWKIIPSWFDKIPFKNFLCSPLRFLAPKIWKSFDFSDFDIVISSSAWYMSKGVSLTKKAKKPIYICYCHTPPRYLYGYPTALNFKQFWWGRLYANIVNPFMRYYDFKSSQTVDFFICNSKEVQKRIAKFYRRDAKVIYPPILTAHKQDIGSMEKGDYFLMVNRLVQHKNVALAIKTCKRLKLKLKVAGSGPEEKNLKKLAAGSTFIEFLGYVNDKKLKELYSNCKAVLYLAEEEDFGITPVEAMAFGKPVIALKSGGVVESVVDKKTGLFIDELKISKLTKAIKKLETKKTKPKDCLNQARKFSKDRFKKQIKDFVNSIT